MRECADGFTLIEVLAAIALLAIAFTVGASTLGRAVRNADRSAALDAAVERAQSLLAAQGLTVPLTDGTRSGTYADGMHWTLKVRAVPTFGYSFGSGIAAAPQVAGVAFPEAIGVDLYQLDVAVQYGRRRVLRLSTERAQTAQPVRP